MSTAPLTEMTGACAAGGGEEGRRGGKTLCGACSGGGKAREWQEQLGRGVAPAPFRCMRSRSGGWGPGENAGLWREAEVARMRVWHRQQGMAPAGQMVFLVMFGCIRSTSGLEVTGGARALASLQPACGCIAGGGAVLCVQRRVAGGKAPRKGGPDVILTIARASLHPWLHALLPGVQLHRCYPRRQILRTAVMFLHPHPSFRPRLAMRAAKGGAVRHCHWGGQGQGK